MDTKADIRPQTSSSKTKSMVIIALMAAVTCILGPLSLAIPISPVPISLTNLAVYFTVYVLDRKRGTISYLLYLLDNLMCINNLINLLNLL